MEGKTQPQNRVYICLPKKYTAKLAEHYQLEHGIFLKELNPYINEGYLRTYFRDWGTVTVCTIRHNRGGPKAVAYVGFSAEDEADKAEWSGPHNIAGDVEVKRVVSVKTKDDPPPTGASVASKPQPRRHMGMGYILEDAEWLDN